MDYGPVVTLALAGPLVTTALGELTTTLARGRLMVHDGRRSLSGGERGWGCCLLRSWLRFRRPALGMRRNRRRRLYYSGTGVHWR